MKFSKNAKLATLATTLLIFLSGCVQVDRATNTPYGPVYDYLAVPTQYILNTIASLVGGNYVISIALVSLIVRLILMPTMFNQMKSMQSNQEKMALLKPHINEINERANNAASPEEKMAIQQETMELYRLNGVSLTGGLGLSGCLPILITLPIYSALYNAINFSTEIRSSTFLGISLGQHFMPLTIATVVIYLIQGYVSQMYMDEEQKKASRSMLYVTPLMMLMFTWGQAAGLGVYFFTSGVFQVFQSWIQNTYIRPRVKAEIDAELAQNGNKVILPERRSASPRTAQKATTQQTTFADRNRNNGKGRNSGKQNRK